jgi:hypothetical protein
MYLFPLNNILEGMSDLLDGNKGWSVFQVQALRGNDTSAAECVMTTTHEPYFIYSSYNSWD